MARTGQLLRSAFVEEPTMSAALKTRPKAKATVRKESSAHQSPVQRIATSVAESRAAERRAMIADAAYFRAERRGFAPGHELEDWLAAELDLTNIQQREATAAFQD
jgi:hypothetical protein